MRKRLISASLFAGWLALLFSLCACAGPSVRDADQKYFIFATPLSSHDIWVQAKEGFDDACELLGIHGDWLGPEVIDIEEMERVIETGILQKCDGIITQGVVDPALVQDAEISGVPVVLVDSDLPSSGRLAYMGKDFHLQAELLLEGVEKKLGKDTPLRIAIQAANLDFQIGQDQVREIRDVFASHPGGYTIIATSQSLSEAVRSKKEWESVIAAHPDINVCLNFAGESALYCSQAVQAAGLQEQIHIFGVDDVPATLELIRSGDIDGSIVTSFYQYGYNGVQILYDYTVNNVRPTDPEVSLILLDAENLDHYRDLVNVTPASSRNSASPDKNSDSSALEAAS